MSLELSPEAHARLNDKKWRRSQSKWMLWIYLTSSALGVIGFARLAIKTKDKTLKNYAYIFSGLLFLIFFLIGISDSSTNQTDAKTTTETTALDTFGGLVVVLNYGLQIFLSFKANKIWLVYRAQNNNPTWTAENLNVKTVAQKAFLAPQELVKDVLGVEGNEYFAPAPEVETPRVTPPPPSARKTPPPPPPQTQAPFSVGTKQSSIELNSCSVEELMKVDGFDPVLAANTVVQREKRGGFSSFEEFANDLKLQPHQVAKLKPIIVIKKQSEGGGNSGRVLDI